MGLKTLWDTLTSPWKLAGALERHSALQEALFHDMMSVQRIQAETNARMSQVLEQALTAMTDGTPPEGRGGLSDDEEMEILVELNRAEKPPKWGNES